MNFGEFVNQQELTGTYRKKNINDFESKSSLENSCSDCEKVLGIPEPITFDNILIFCGLYKREKGFKLICLNKCNWDCR